MMFKTKPMEVFLAVCAISTLGCASCALVRCIYALHKENEAFQNRNSPKVQWAVPAQAVVVPIEEEPSVHI